MSRSENPAVSMGNPASDFADWSDVAGLQRSLVESCTAIAQSTTDVALAKHVITYDSDRRKRALARAMSPALAGGSSAPKAEAEARACESYSEEMKRLGKEFAAASQVILDYEASKLKWETARSLLAMQREAVKQL